MADGNLRSIFRDSMPTFHWVSVESAMTEGGIPDSNFCRDGVEGWIEHKKTNGYAVVFQRFQPAWIDHRVRVGGRVFIAVRRTSAAGPRRGAAVDELWLYPGSAVWELDAQGLKETHALALGVWLGGPQRWAWGEVEKLLLAPT